MDDMKIRIFLFTALISTNVLAINADIDGGEHDEKKPLTEYDLIKTLADLKKHCYICDGSSGQYVMEHRSHDGSTKEEGLSIVYNLYNSDISYLGLDNITTPLQKKVFLESEEYINKYKGQLESERKSLLEDDYMIDLAEGLVETSYDLNRRCFKFKYNYPEIESGLPQKSVFYFGYNRFYLSIPKSKVAMEYISGNSGYCTIYTSQVPESDAVSIERQRDIHLACVFNLTSMNKESKYFNIVYGKPKKLYIVNGMGEILYDVTATLSAPNNKYISFKKGKKSTKPNVKYHDRGKTENCYMCGGKGRVTSWRTGRPVPCNICGGKGWYIEHYW